MKFSVPEILTIVSTATVMAIAFLVIAKYLIRYAVTFYAKIKGDTGTTSITNCTISLKDSNGNEVKSWSNLSSKSSMLVCSKTTSNITKGETYTLSVSAYVNRNGSSEYVSDSVSKKY